MHDTTQFFYKILNTVSFDCAPVSILSADVHVPNRNAGNRHQTTSNR